MVLSFVIHFEFKLFNGFMFKLNKQQLPNQAAHQKKIMLKVCKKKCLLDLGAHKDCDLRELSTWLLYVNNFC